MARFDVYPNRGSSAHPYLLDVQCDLLQNLASRVVVPLRRVDAGFANIALPRNLTPVFEIGGVSCLMETPALAAVPVKSLPAPLLSLRDHQADITSALDFLFQGY